MKSLLIWSTLAIVLQGLAPRATEAHFLWIVQGQPATTSEKSSAAPLHVYFGEAAEADDPDLLKGVKGAQVWQLTADGKSRAIKLKMGEDSLVGTPRSDDQASLFALRHSYGVIDRGNSRFLLNYYGKTGPALGSPLWQKVDSGEKLALDIVPGPAADGVQLQIQWQGKPVAGAEVKIQGPGLDDELEATSSPQGQVNFTIPGGGLYSIRARHIEKKTGTHQDDSYDTVRHYCTLALNVPAGKAKDPSAKAGEHPEAPAVAARQLAALPQPVTSFGAAVLGDDVYVYGGHKGAAHSYSRSGQSNLLWKLPLDGKSNWETVSKAEHLQGLAMVALKGNLYRIGGFTARNAEDEDHDLWSQDAVARFAPDQKKWLELPPLPEPRSSHDAAVLGGRIYVAGGWQLRGDQDSRWHTTAWSIDPTAATPKWKPLPTPPFQRRAISLASHDGRLFVIGGMQSRGGPTTRVDYYDPQKGKWFRGPDLQGKPMDGFGSSSFATNGNLYVTTISGKLQRLSSDGAAWEVVGNLERSRFFHRMVPIADGKLLLVGGADMRVGKFDEVDVVEVD